MKLKTWIPLTLAIVLGLVAAKVARDKMANSNKGNSNPSNLAQVVILKRTVQPGTELRSEDLTIGQVAPDSKPEGAFTNTSDLVGRVCQIQINKGQAVVEPLLAPTGTGSGLAAVVPNGMRAITLEVNEFSGLAGMVTPGSEVDVLVCVQGDGGTDMLSRTIVEDVKVIAVGQRMAAGRAESRDGQPEPFRSVTLLANAEEAEALDLAASTGRPRLVLRNGRDDHKLAGDGVSVSDLRGRAHARAQTTDPFAFLIPTSTPATQPSRPTKIFERPIDSRSIKVIRGGQESVVPMPLNGPGSEEMSSTHIEREK